MVKNPPANVGDEDSIPGSGRLLGKEIAACSSIPAWKSHGQKNLAGCESTGSQRAGHHLATQQQRLITGEADMLQPQPENSPAPTPQEGKNKDRREHLKGSPLRLPSNGITLGKYEEKDETMWVNKLSREMKLPFSKYHLLQPKTPPPHSMETALKQLQAFPREPASTLPHPRPLQEATTRHNTHSHGVFFIGFLGVLTGVEALCFVISSLGPTSSSTSSPSGGPLVTCPETGEETGRHWLGGEIHALSEVRGPRLPVPHSRSAHL